MRTLIKIRVPVEAGNKAIREGTMGQIIQRTIESLKAETAFFGVENGQRTGYIVANVANTHDLVPVLEPVFIQLNAQIDFLPVMSGEELGKGLSQVKV